MTEAIHLLMSLLRQQQQQQVSKQKQEVRDIPTRSS